jgi:serine/threonine-protein kinase PknG
LLRCRAELSQGALARARDAWAGAERQYGRDDWRIRWHKALIELAAENAADAFGEFMAVYQELPGELVPKLGLGLCAEYLGDLRTAERRYQTVWQADRSYVTAAFGLARTWMRRGDRSRAVAAVDDVPDGSRHARAARIAAFRLLTGMSEHSGSPAQRDLDDAQRRMSHSPLRGDDLGEAYDGLRAMLLEARLWRARSEPEPAPPVAVAGLRGQLERCYRDLAGHAASERQHTVLVDLANQVRPRTLD